MKNLFNAIREDWKDFIVCILGGIFEIGLFLFSILCLTTLIDPNCKFIVVTILFILWLPLSIMLGSITFFENR